MGRYLSLLLGQSVAPHYANDIMELQIIAWTCCVKN